MSTEILKEVRRTSIDRNKLRQEDRAVHDWYRFVLSYPPHLVRNYLEQLGVSSTNTVLDPFCGTGTTLVECKKLGIANPPFNVSDWGGERLRDDRRWEYGVPPAGNANFAWVQHFLYHLAPRGTAGFVLANGSMSSNQSGEGEIRKNLIEADLVDCIVALPGQLFRSTQIPACLWFLSRGRGKPNAGVGLVPARHRGRETLFIDARKLGHMVDRTHRDLTPEDIARIADTYHAWRGQTMDSPLPLGEGQSLPRTRSGGEGKGYADVPGFCKSATLEEIRKHGHVLTPGRYVGAEPQPDDGEPFEDKMARLIAQWREQQAEAQHLDAAIEENLTRLGFGDGRGDDA